MNTSSTELLIREVEKLERQWKWQRWVELAFGAALVLLAFYLTSDSAIVPEVIASIPTGVYAGIGGAFLGGVWRNWRGSRELELLREFRNHSLSSESRTRNRAKGQVTPHEKRNTREGKCRTT